MIRSAQIQGLRLAFAAVAVMAGILCNADAQDSKNVKTLDDLKAAINSPSSFEVIRDMDSWLPGLIASLSWETRMSDHFIMHYHNEVHGDDDSVFESFDTESEKIYRQLEVFFEIESKSKRDVTAMLTKLSCFIVKTRTDKTFGSFTNPHVLFYMMDPNDDPEFMVQFRHEYAHWVWSRMYGSAPSLFHEGIATYAEKMSAPDASVSEFLENGLDVDYIPPLEEIAINENFWKHDQGRMYTAGSLLIHFLVEEYGWDRLKEFCLLTDFQDPDVLAHFEQAYGCSLDSVDAELRKSLRSPSLSRNGDEL